MFLIGLIEASLETLPKELWSTRKAVSLSRRMKIEPRYILLDKSLFYNEMKKYGISGKRGRPDIVYMFLNAMQYSPLNKKGLLRVFVHTINDYIIEVNPKTRPPKSYYQFMVLMQHLFKHSKVPPTGEPLMLLRKNMSLRDYLESKGVTKPVLLWEKGECKPPAWFADKKFPPHAILVGGFPHGDFREETLQLAWERVSIYKGIQLDAWVVADRVLCFIENNCATK